MGGKRQFSYNPQGSRGKNNMAGVRLGPAIRQGARVTGGLGFPAHHFPARSCRNIGQPLFNGPQ